MTVEAVRVIPQARGTAAPWHVAAVAAAAYVVLLGGIWHLHGIQGFIHLGSGFVGRSERSAVITPHLQTDNRTGYDGQFYFFVAADPANARYYMDSPGYVYPRIVYPMLARGLALGRPSAIPYSLVLINLAAVAASVLALASWLRRRRITPWAALAYGFFPGLAFCVYRDLTEPLAFAFAIGGAVVLARGTPRAHAAAAGLFALAVLTRETTAVFPVVYAVGILLGGGGAVVDALRRNWLRAIVFATAALLPLLVDRLAFRFWLGGSTVESGPGSPWPFAGLAAWWPWTGKQLLVVLAATAPALIWAVACLLVIRRRGSTPELWLVIANVLVFAVFLPAPVDVDYGSAGRALCGAVAASVLALPALAAAFPEHRRTRRALIVLWTPVAYLGAVVIVLASGL